MLKKLIEMAIRMGLRPRTPEPDTWRGGFNSRKAYERYYERTDIIIKDTKFKCINREIAKSLKPGKADVIVTKDGHVVIELVNFMGMIPE